MRYSAEHFVNEENLKQTVNRVENEIAAVADSVPLRVSELFNDEHYCTADLVVLQKELVTERDDGVLPADTTIPRGTTITDYIFMRSLNPLSVRWNNGVTHFTRGETVRLSLQAKVENTYGDIDKVILQQNNEDKYIWYSNPQPGQRQLVVGNWFGVEIPLSTPSGWSTYDSWSYKFDFLNYYKSGKIVKETCFFYWDAPCYKGTYGGVINEIPSRENQNPAEIKVSYNLYGDRAVFKLPKMNYGNAVIGISDPGNYFNYLDTFEVTIEHNDQYNLDYYVYTMKYSCNGEFTFLFKTNITDAAKGDD